MASDNTNEGRPLPTEGNCRQYRGTEDGECRRRGGIPYYDVEGEGRGSGGGWLQGNGPSEKKMKQFFPSPKYPRRFLRNTTRQAT